MKAVRRLGAIAVSGFMLVACSRSGAETTTATLASSSTSAATTTTVTPGRATTTDTSTTDTSTTATTTDPTTTDPTTTTSEPGTTTTTADPIAYPEVADPGARPAVLVSNMNRGSIDDFDPTGDDIYKAVIELIDLFNYLEGHPTGTAEEIAGLMYERDYPRWDGIVANYEELTSNPGWHYTDPGIRTLGIEVLDLSGDTATVMKAHDRGTQIIRDSDDEVVRRYVGWEPSVTIFTYHRGEDGRWRISDRVPRRPATDEEIASMVPVEWTARQP